MNVSISNINEDRNTFYVIDDLLNKSVSRISRNAECPFTSSSRQAFFLITSFSQANFGGVGLFGISEHFRSQERPYVGYRIFLPTCLAINNTPQLRTCEPQAKYSQPCRLTAQHSPIILLSRPAKLSAKRASLFVYTILAISPLNHSSFTSSLRRSRNPVRER